MNLSAPALFWAFNTCTVLCLNARTESFHSAHLLYVSSVPNSPRGVPPSGVCRFGALQLQITNYKLQIRCFRISNYKLQITCMSTKMTRILHTLTDYPRRNVVCARGVFLSRQDWKWSAVRTHKFSHWGVPPSGVDSPSGVSALQYIIAQFHE